MKLRELLGVLGPMEKVTITDQCYDRETKKYISFRTVYNRTPLQNVLDDADNYVLDLEVKYAGSYGFREMVITVASFIDEND